MERAIPIVPADDLRIAKQFYVDRLGFKVRFEATEDGKSGLLGLNAERFASPLIAPCPAMAGTHVSRCRWKAPMRITMNGGNESRFDVHRRTRRGVRARSM